jgi:hypothetical protein
VLLQQCIIKVIAFLWSFAFLLGAFCCGLLTGVLSDVRRAASNPLSRLTIVEADLSLLSELTIALPAEPSWWSEILAFELTELLIAVKLSFLLLVSSYSRTSGTLPGRR